MLVKLQKKLYRMLTGVLMLIVTFILGLIQYDNIKSEWTAADVLFQRMSTMLTYEIRGNLEESIRTFEAYEREYQIYIRLKNGAGRILYESSLKFSTDGAALAAELERQAGGNMAYYRLWGREVTEQGGIYRLRGDNGEVYRGIPVTIVGQDGGVQYLELICRRTPASELIRRKVLFLGGTWLTVFAGILLVCRILLNKAMEPTRRGLEGQKNFVASASHELKAPLAVITAEAEEIGNLSAGKPEIAACVQAIDSECQRMSGLVQDLLLLASTDAGAVSLYPREVNVDTILFSLYESYEALCIQKGVKLSVEMEEKELPELKADPDRLIQVLRIFMDNAVRFSKKGSGIELQARALKNEICFSVADHGTGISAEDAAHVFERFYCGDKSRTDQSHYGLGLSIAAEITRMMGGRIGFRETPGGGCTFWAAFPVS